MWLKLVSQNDISQIAMSHKCEQRFGFGLGQKTREFMHLKSIEEQRAKERYGGHDKKTIQENLPELKRGQSRDIATGKIGMSGRTAEQISVVEGKNIFTTTLQKGIYVLHN